MGGLCFMAVTVVVTLALILSNRSISFSGEEARRAYIVLAAASACGLLGFADDFGKITSKSNTGISGKVRLAAEFALGLLLGLGLLSLKETPVQFVLGLAPGGSVISLPPLETYGALIYYFIAVPFIYAGSANALNLHDGMDGLCGGTSFMVFSSLALMLFFVDHCAALCCISAGAAAAILAFLIYNKYPARVFMGDTGSLFIGALMAGIVIYGGLIFWFIPLSLIYIIETLSVMTQVVYFKLTKPFTPEKPMSAAALAIHKLTHKLPGEGKRLFRMAPIHHHFEAVGAEAGLKEWQVVILFCLTQLIICSLTVFAFCVI